MADFITDRGFSTTPIYVTDLGRCQPADRLSPDGGFRRWHTIPYQAEGFSGVMLKAGPETPCAGSSLPIEHDRLACNLHWSTPNQRRKVYLKRSSS